jgi:putative SOS response-associated peptidase YedK
MCGRFALTTDANQLAEEFDVKIPSDFKLESYNIAPSHVLPIIHLDHNHNRQISLMEWGFLPSWANNLKDTSRPINARVETINSSPMFKSSFQKRRCLIPATGFYEWSSKKSPKQPYYFYEKDRPLFAFAGLWNIWEKEAGVILSFTIITKEAEESVKPIHTRMPFVINKEHYDKWLNDAQLPERPPSLVCHPVSLAVNSPRNNHISLIDKLSD